MAKYTKEFKQMVIDEYLTGIMGYKALAKKYNIISHNNILTWVKSYELFGDKGIERKSKKTNFTGEFKLDVLNYKKSTGSSYTDTALRFGLNNPSLIANWNTTFLNEGVEGLSRDIGRPCKMKKKTKSKDKPKTELEKLIRENELLRLENSYLKKLKALLEKEEASLEGQNQKYPLNLTKKDLD